MNINKLAIGMEVKAKNCFGLTYRVVKVNKTTVWLEHKTGEKVMRNGKWADLVFTYKGIKPSNITEICNN